MSRSARPHPPLPLREGVAASCVALQQGPWPGVLDFLAARLPAVARADWARRMDAGGVVDATGRPVAPDAPHVRHAPGHLYYWRALAGEPPLPFEATVLHRCEHLVVADKPHFMPVLPTGPYLQRSLLVRLCRALGIATLSPLHRIDRETAGVVLFSVRPAERGAYQALFAGRAVRKTYEAVAPWHDAPPLPAVLRLRMAPAAEFFRERVVAGEPNTETALEVIDVRGDRARYRLHPATGRKHQLRVHMAAIGRPIANDPWYPVVNDPPAGDYSRPLQLLARRLAFTDPLTGAPRVFESQRSLQWP